MKPSHGEVRFYNTNVPASLMRRLEVMRKETRLNKQQFLITVLEQYVSQAKKAVK